MMGRASPPTSFSAADVIWSCAPFIPSCPFFFSRKTNGTHLLSRTTLTGKGVGGGKAEEHGWVFCEATRLCPKATKVTIVRNSTNDVFAVAR
jgi:hypothetical protein